MSTLKSMLKWTPLLAVALFLISCGGGSPPSNVTFVSFESDGTTCTPDSFDTGAGYLVKITLKNTGTTAVEFNYPGGPYKFSASAGQTTLGNFTSPTVNGKYDFTCAQTKGTMQVKNNP